jgi:tRNA(Ile)-lysidine synthetase-like protein
MNYPKGKLFLEKVENTVKDFIDKYDLVQDNKIVVAVSGGVDSQCLAYILVSCGYSIEILYINHGTRISQNTEQKLVKKTAGHLGVNCTTFKIKSLEQNDFENSARIERKKIYEYMSQGRRLVALGHHIDDSFEWSLMQKSKSSNLRASIGIPVKNKFIIRPLMCLTKSQIRRYANLSGIKSLEDPTNTENRFERNYYRNEIIPLIAKRNPQYLKHYVNQQRELVDILGLGLKTSKGKFKIDIKTDSVFIYSFKGQVDLDSIDRLVVRGVKSLSNLKRGTLNLQIKKIKQAIQNNKFGPLLLADGINAFVSTNSVLLTKLQTMKIVEPKSYKKLDLVEFKNLINKNITHHESFPHWVKVDCNTRFVSPNNRVYPFNQKDSLKIVESNVLHQNAFKLLLQWDTKRNCKKKLDLTF